MANALETKLSNAKDVARKFLVEEITEQRIGEYLGFEVEGENVATHKFKCVDKAYVGWNWAVTLAVVDQSSEVTVSEILLLPGDGAILASSWIPWEQRVEPGDIGIGDVLPTAPDDIRLVPGYTGVDDLFDEKLTPEGWEVRFHPAIAASAIITISAIIVPIFIVFVIIIIFSTRCICN